MLLFFDNTIFFEQLARCCPFTAEEIRGMVVHTEKLLKDFDIGRITAGTFYSRAVDLLGAAIDREDFFRFYNDVFRINPPVLELYTRLARDIRLIMLSNTDVERFGHIRRTYPEIFLFDDYVLSYEVGRCKPDPEIYEEAVRRCGGRPEECVFIDDLEKNTAAAEAMGIPSILYGPQIDLEGRLRELGIEAGG